MTQESLPSTPAPAEITGHPEVIVRSLTEYSDEVAASLGRLMKVLDPSFSDAPVPRERLERIIDSPYHEQLVAEKGGEIVGAATMTMILEPGFEGMGYLGAFVVDPAAQGSGVADKVWGAMGEWCRRNGLKAFEFKTEVERESAVRFYDKRAHRVSNAILYEADATTDEPAVS